MNAKYFVAYVESKIKYILIFLLLHCDIAFMTNFLVFILDI